jgi:hypothetical protein
LFVVCFCGFGGFHVLLAWELCGFSCHLIYFLVFGSSTLVEKARLCLGSLVVFVWPCCCRLFLSLVPQPFWPEDRRVLLRSQLHLLLLPLPRVRARLPSRWRLLQLLRRCRWWGPSPLPPVWRSFRRRLRLHVLQTAGRARQVAWPSASSASARVACS